MTAQAPTTSDRQPHSTALTSNSDHSIGVNHSNLPSLTIAPFPLPSVPSQALAMACLVEVKREKVCSAAATRTPNQKAPRLYSPIFPPRFCLIASRDIVVRQDARRGTVEIVILADIERPQEAGRSGQAEQQRQRHRVNAGLHALRITHRKGRERARIIAGGTPR